MTVDVTLFTRDHCELCDEARAELHRISQTLPLNIIEIDIDSDERLEREYGERIPVIGVDSTQFAAPIDWHELKATLIATEATGSYSSQPVTGRKRRLVIGMDKGILWLARHWLAVLSLFVALYAGIPFLAPIAMENGATGLANTIYTVYSPVCHQFAFRSWFLYGDQTAYPRARAEVDSLTPFETYAANEPAFNGIDLTTLDNDLIITAKRFIGSDRMGWKVAFCERDVAIYAALALSGVLFIFLKRAGVDVPKLPFWAYVLIAIVPIGLDGFSQYFANPPFNAFGLDAYPIRESTPFLRVLTGALFGFGNGWLVFPYIEESMQETVEMLETKLRRAGELPAKSTTAQP